MKVGVVGGGVVGHATARSYLEHVDEVRVYDVIPEKATHSLPEVLECDLIFVCLPTPQKEGSLECDTKYLIEFFATLPAAYSSANIVIRSTVPIGFTKRIRGVFGLSNLVHSPEFLTARCAVPDAQLPSRNIIGAPNGRSSVCDGYLIDLYQKRFPHVPIQVMSSDESEAVKLFQNSFFAVKIAFWNECHMLASKLGLDWECVMEGILSDGRIHPSHTKVPGPDGAYGFGGTCLPKDLANLLTHILPSYEEGFYHTNGGSVCLAAHIRNETIDRRRT